MGNQSGRFDNGSTRLAVDHYLTACVELGQLPNKPCSGRFVLRLPPAVHAHAKARAEAEGLGFDQWASKVLERAANDR